ncbi:hypothetical protein COE51_21355 [Bacillus pseudomycoides]|nr:hypothetical protein COE51_21355 [Bacillus pseudomycoides]
MDIKTVTSIATFITSLVSLGTLWNVTKQRLTSNRPDIYVKDKPFKMSLAQPENITLPIYNIGLGSAKNIKITWKLDDEFVIKVKELDINNDNLIEYESKSNVYVGKHNKLIYLIHDLNEKIDFLLPYKSDSSTTDTILMPHSLTVLYSIYIELSVKHNIYKQEELFIFEINYQDVNNKRYTKQFNVKFVLHTVDKNEVTGLIEIN